MELELKLVELYFANHDVEVIETSMSKYFRSLDLYKVSMPSLRLMMYINCNLKTRRKGFISSQSIELSSDIEGISRNGFFDGIKELISLNIIVKLKPGLFGVNPGYLNRMSLDQRVHFNSKLMNIIAAHHFRDL